MLVVLLGLKLNAIYFFVRIMIIENEFLVYN